MMFQFRRTHVASITNVAVSQPLHAGGIGQDATVQSDPRMRPQLSVCTSQELRRDRVGLVRLTLIDPIQAHDYECSIG